MQKAVVPLFCNSGCPSLAIRARIKEEFTHGESLLCLNIHFHSTLHEKAETGFVKIFSRHPDVKYEAIVDLC